MQTNPYESQARYYKNLLIINRQKACLHVEDTNDKAFWKAIFLKFFPNDSFHYITYSKSNNENNTTGCEQCLKFKPYLDKHFLICIDSDYRFLYQETDIDIQHFIFQTYTYSFENHLCHEDSFNKTCKSCTGFDNTSYDYPSFIKQFSNIIYELFIWHISLYKNNPSDFEKDVFLQILDMGSIVANKQNEYLFALQTRITAKLTSLQATHPNFDLLSQKTYYESMGVKNENVYLYIRGHNLFALFQKIANDTCSSILDTEKNKLRGNNIKIQNLYNNRKKISVVIGENILWNTYPEIRKIENDINTFTSF